jgi:hypothetical protein
VIPDPLQALRNFFYGLNSNFFAFVVEMLGSERQKKGFRQRFGDKGGLV